MKFQEWFSALQEKNYPNSATWAHYFTGKEPWLQKPETCLSYLTQYIPSYVDTVLILGCANGKDFIPFQNRYALYGTDISPANTITWAPGVSGVIYKCISIEHMVDSLEKSSVDLSSTIIFSSGVLMYVSPNEQKRFYRICKEKGCKNFIFQEYSTRTTKHQEERLHLREYIPEFIVKNYRGGNGSEQPIAHINLDISNEQKGQLFEEFVPENIPAAFTTRDHARALLTALRIKLRIWK